MKRDQVARHLKPLEEAGIDVEIIQLAPLSIYNFVCFDRLNVEGAYDPANPPASIVIISLGTDTTDLVITNGYRVWQRSIPIGGNHFTKSLTKELKLTFAKAEHLKRNAMKAENPKAVFQAMRPVFSDLVAEIQRSIGFFTSNNRNAKLGEMIALGNPMKLPGLQRFLSQNLDQQVKLVDSFNNLVGGTATAGPQFKENQLTFGVAYGLCVQALDNAQLRTNLLPDEIITTRLVRAKKPWAVAAVAVLLVGMTINYFSHYASILSANDSDPAMKSAITAAKGVKSDADKGMSDNQTLLGQFDKVVATAHNLQSNVDGRLLWMELLKAIDTALPKDNRKPDQKKETAEDIAKREELHIESMECEYFADLAPWQAYIQRYYSPPPQAAAAAAPTAPTDESAAAGGAAQTPSANGTTPPVDGATPPAGGTAATPTPPADQTAAQPTDGAAPAASAGGWIIEMRGYHFHNSLSDPKVNVGDEGEEFVTSTFIRALQTGKVKLPDGPDGKMIDVPMADLGIKFPVVVTHSNIQPAQRSAESADAQLTGGPVRSSLSPEGPIAPGAGAATPGVNEPKVFKLRKYPFVVQFAWVPQPRGQRQEAAQKKAAAEAAAKATAGDGAATTGPHS
jgi:type IV pilus assembly protein PilM